MSRKEDQLLMSMLSAVQVAIQTVQKTGDVSCRDVKSLTKITIGKHSK